MIKKYSLLALEKAINHALSLDTHTLSKIEKLDGKKLEVIVAPLGINFYICFEGNILKLKDNIDGKVDTSIYSSPLGLIRLSFLPASKARSLFNDKIRLSGDVELGNEVKRLFDELDIDWEGHLAQFTGDVVAHQLGSFARKTLAFKNHFSHSLRNNLTDYLQEELTLFPPREEINDFFDDIDELSLRVERLQAKMNQLMASS
ncbi:MAG: SCP2 sterol-binding domain-containing protein [Proteobacteria bacterium]|nr:SCP2 sterol-binding domain-containing protein [Pseudomonadota bacterium]